MKTENIKWPHLVGGALGIAALSALITYQASKGTQTTTDTKVKVTAESENVLIGDVGGTNVRLELKKLYSNLENAHKNENLKPR